MSVCFDCQIEGDDEDPGCGHPVVYCSCWCHEDLPDDADDSDSGPCMGADKGCVNPHPGHRYRDCETAEMHETAAACGMEPK